MMSEISLAALEVVHLSKTYRTRSTPVHALDDVSFNIAPGECFALLGVNGAGKSTLISTLAGVVIPDAGDIKVCGYSIRNDRKVASLHVGIVPQEITIDPFFTVWELLCQQSGYFGLLHNEAWLNEILDNLDLIDKKHARVGKLSGGMKRRVLIALSLVHRPPVIVLDEPTAGVDVYLRQRIWDFIEKLHAKGHTIILTTHYLQEAQSLCDRVGLLHQGRLIALDRTENLLAQFSGYHIVFEWIQGALPELVRQKMHCEVTHKLEPPMVINCTCADQTELTNLLVSLQTHATEIEKLRVESASLEEVFLRLTQEQKQI